ncbi:MAG: hypothetical protein FWE80_07050 [Oscillospiraceae bacterium]|nr:hypothetical protein [Oscillospiraceae bacterium]
MRWERLVKRGHAVCFLLLAVIAVAAFSPVLQISAVYGEETSSGGGGLGTLFQLAGGGTGGRLVSEQDYVYEEPEEPPIFYIDGFYQNARIAGAVSWVPALVLPAAVSVAAGTVVWVLLVIFSLADKITRWYARLAWLPALLTPLTMAALIVSAAGIDNWLSTAEAVSALGEDKLGLMARPGPAFWILAAAWLGFGLFAFWLTRKRRELAALEQRRAGEMETIL